MRPHVPPTCRLTLFLFLSGFILCAQEIEYTSTFEHVNEVSKENRFNANDQKQKGCFEYSGYVVSKKTGDPIVDVFVELRDSDNGLVTTLRTDRAGRYHFSLPCDLKFRKPRWFFP